MDDGLFPADAQIRRINREATVLGAAGYAILLQVAHPAVGQGVHDHSDFTARPINRLRGTLTFVYGTVFGTREEAERIQRIVHAMHRRVTGPGYHGLDPDLQVWVAGTLYDGGVRLYEMTVGPLTEEEKDEAYAQSTVFATSLGCPRDRWPATRAEFEGYWADMVDSLEINDVTREIAHGLFHPANPLVRPLARLQRFLTAGLLPAHLRAGLGLEWGPAQQRGFDRLFSVIRSTYPHLPMALRALPKNAYMWDMRRQAARNRLYQRPKRLARRPQAGAGGSGRSGPSGRPEVA